MISWFVRFFFFKYFLLLQDILECFSQIPWTLWTTHIWYFLMCKWDGENDILRETEIVDYLCGCSLLNARKLIEKLFLEFKKKFVVEAQLFALIKWLGNTRTNILTLIKKKRWQPPLVDSTKNFSSSWYHNCLQKQ